MRIKLCEENKTKQKLCEKRTFKEETSEVRPEGVSRERRQRRTNARDLR